MVHMDAWLRKVDEIADEGPSYQLGHDGSDGTCDCIGLIIGAIRRAGGKWTGTHGSNWAARNTMVSIGPVDEAPFPGCLVYKRRDLRHKKLKQFLNFIWEWSHSHFFHIEILCWCRICAT